MLLCLLAMFGVVTRRFMHPTGHPPQHEIRDFTPILQPDQITCGPTAVLTVLNRYDRTPAFEQVERLCRTRWFTYRGEAVGLTPPEFIKSALAAFGLAAEIEHAALDRLEHLVSRGRPPIVLLRSGPTTWHYVVVVGFSPGWVVVVDPAIGGRHRLTANEFVGAWGFVTDMNGVPVVDPCPVCGGTGRWAPLRFGPLSICEACGGTGSQPDYLGGLVRAADVEPYTLIVPARPVP